MAYPFPGAQPFYFCDTCSLRILSPELEDGKASVSEVHKYCSACNVARPLEAQSPGVSDATHATGPVEQVKGRTGVIARPNSTRGHMATPAASSTARRTSNVASAPNLATVPETSNNKNTIYMGVGGALVGVLIIVVMLLSRGGKGPGQGTDKNKTDTLTAANTTGRNNNTEPPSEKIPDTTPKDTTNTPPDKTSNSGNAGEIDKGFENTRNQHAQNLLKEAKDFAAAKPILVREYRNKLLQIIQTYRTTPAAEDALKLLAAGGEPLDDPWLKAPLPSDADWKKGINLFAILDPQKDVVASTGKLQGNMLNCAKQPFVKIALPYTPPDEYDFRISFHRGQGDQKVVQYCTANGHKFMWVLDDNGYFGFSLIGGNEATENPSTVRGDKILGNRRYTSVVSVRKDGVRAYLDGRLITYYKTDFKDMSMPEPWKLNDEVCLGLGTQNAHFNVFEIDVLEIGGKGTITRKPEEIVVNEVVVEPVVSTPAVKTVSPLLSKIEYSRVLNEAYVNLSKFEVSAAQAKLEKAKADPQLASMKDNLALDQAMFKYTEEIKKASVAGLTLLVDKRPFTLKKLDGKTVSVGKGSTVSLIGIKSDELQLEEAFGGATASFKIQHGDLTPETHYALAKLGLKPGPESALSLAFQALALASTNSPEITFKEVRARIGEAQKEKAAPEKIALLTERVELEDLEPKVEPAWRAIEKLYQDKKYDEARKALEVFVQFAGTRASIKLAAVIQKTIAELDSMQNNPASGLWVSYWSGNPQDQFKTFHFGRVETKISRDYGSGSPDPRLPADHFGIVMGGVLRIDKPGKYTFSGKADDAILLLIDGKKIVETTYCFGPNPINNHTGSIELSKGDHEFRIVYTEIGGGAGMSLSWALEGGFPAQEIPVSALRCNPQRAEAYQVK